jgi:hypothetical protein
MNYALKLTVLTAALIVGLAAFAAPARADFDIATLERDYQDAMWYLVPALGEWATELESTVDTAELKPERACQIDLPELAHRGEYMGYDLQGTWAPASLHAAHEDMIASLARMTDTAAAACDDLAGASTAIHAEMATFDRARHKILRYLVSGIEDPVAPIRVQPVTLN